MPTQNRRITYPIIGQPSHSGPRSPPPTSHPCPLLGLPAIFCAPLSQGLGQVPPVALEVEPRFLCTKLGSLTKHLHHVISRYWLFAGGSLCRLLQDGRHREMTTRVGGGGVEPVNYLLYMPCPTATNSFKGATENARPIDHGARSTERFPASRMTMSGLHPSNNIGHGLKAPI